MSSTVNLKCLRISSVLTFLALLFILVLGSEGLSLEKICESRCFYGRGGNLCNCNAVHFAGKRLAVGGVVAKRDFVSKTSEQSEGPEGPAENPPSSGHTFRQRHNGEASLELDANDETSLIAGGFLDEGRQRSTAVQKLASLLKDAIDERLVDNMPPEKSSPWQNDVPYDEDSAMY